MFGGGGNASYWCETEKSRPYPFEVKLLKLLDRNPKLLNKI
ncbi:MAG: hypothetical protein ACR5K7_05715 [Symbiopectobacterium sp.]